MRDEVSSRLQEQDCSSYVKARCIQVSQDALGCAYLPTSTTVTLAALLDASEDA